jgi:hypothetical protein
MLMSYVKQLCNFPRINQKVCALIQYGNEFFHASKLPVIHGTKQYADGAVSTNTAESSFAILKRGIMGIFHAVSKEHLHRYVGEFDFRWNTRNLNDGERTVLAMQGAIGKRLVMPA